MKKYILFVLIIISVCEISAQNWVKVWSDEFDQTGLPDSTKWQYEVGMIRNSEYQYYTSKRLENARIENSNLIIEARNENQFGNGSTCTSASLYSQFKGDWKYGKIEIMAKIPTGKGTWPALWLMPSNSEYGGWPKSGEIDIMENVGFDPDNIFFTAHYEGLGGSGQDSNGSSHTFNQPYAKFLKYSIIWSPDKIEWYVDDVLYHTYTKTLADYRVWPFDKEFYLILNLAIGGSWGAQQGVDPSIFPSKYYIDYVKVYQLEETGPYTLTIPDSKNGIVNINPSKTFYSSGDQVTLTATPNEGCTFKNWMYWGGTNPLTLSMFKNLNMIPIFENKNELIKNGDFTSGSLYWQNIYLYNTSTMSATAFFENGEQYVDITKPGSLWWHIGNQQVGISVKGGKTYRLTFDAWSSNSAVLGTSLSKNYDDYGTYLENYYSIKAGKQTFTWDFTPPSTDVNCRMYFGVGNFPVGKVFFDNVSLVELSKTQVSNVLNDSFKVYPNPIKESINFSKDIPYDGNVTVSLFDTAGKETIIHSARYSAGKQMFRLTLDRKSLINGVYFMEVRLNNVRLAFTKLIVG